MTGVRARWFLPLAPLLGALTLVRCGGAATTGPRTEAAVVRGPPRAAAAGDPCPTDGKVECADPSSALLCRHGALLGVRCRGPQGCVGRGDASKCHDEIRDEGDACIESTPDSTACTPDGTSELVCKGGKDEVNRRCRGPDKCHVDGDTVRCDDDFAEVGERCEPTLGDDNYSCSVDRSQMILCDRKSRTFGSYAVCRGPDHCQVMDHGIHCDMNVGRAGELCDPVGNLTCSEDARSELECSDVGTWVKKSDCRKSACSVRDHIVSCE